MSLFTSPFTFIPEDYNAHSLQSEYQPSFVSSMNASIAPAAHNPVSATSAGPSGSGYPIQLLPPLSSPSKLMSQVTSQMAAAATTHHPKRQRGEYYIEEYPEPEEQQGQPGPAEKPRPMGACARCKSLKVRCEFRGDNDTCKRCASASSECVMWKPHRMLPKRELLLKQQIGEQATQIQELMAELDATNRRARSGSVSSFSTLEMRDLSEYITKVGDYPVARGGFGEIWKCHYQTPEESIEVAVKALLVYAADQLEGSENQKKLIRIWRELKTGAKLRHKNILPTYGYTYGFGKFAAMVSPWAEKGSLLAYLEVENAALTPVRRFEILRDISAGLHYLHSNDVVHGDLTAPNILIHGDGTACLCDFGLSLVLSEVMGSSCVTSTLRGNCRWMAPELLNVHENEPLVLPSKISDIYSFGGIMLHVLTGQMPYYYLRNEAQVINSIINRVNPYRSRYSPIADKHWYFIEQCWETATEDRPSIGQVDQVINAELYFISVIEPRHTTPSTHNAASGTS